MESHGWNPMQDQFGEMRNKQVKKKKHRVGLPQKQNRH